MTSPDHDIDDEATLSCRYLLYSEAPGGELHVEQPLCDAEPVSGQTPRHWVLVKRTSDPPPPPSEPAALSERSPISSIVVKLLCRGGS